jgi:hypothetical protein
MRCATGAGFTAGRGAIATNFVVAAFAVATFGVAAVALAAFAVRSCDITTVFAGHLLCG